MAVELLRRKTYYKISIVKVKCARYLLHNTYIPYHVTAPGPLFQNPEPGPWAT